MPKIRTKKDAQVCRWALRKALVPLQILYVLTVNNQCFFARTQTNNSAPAAAASEMTATDVISAVAGAGASTGPQFFSPRVSVDSVVGRTPIVFDVVAGASGSERVSNLSIGSHDRGSSIIMLIFAPLVILTMVPAFCLKVGVKGRPFEHQLEIQPLVVLTVDM